MHAKVLIINYFNTIFLILLQVLKSRVICMPWTETLCLLYFLLLQSRSTLWIVLYFFWVYFFCSNHHKKILKKHIRSSSHLIFFRILPINISNTSSNIHQICHQQQSVYGCIYTCKIIQNLYWGMRK